MNINLNNKVALVTGGSKGIGRAIAFSLAEAGAKVAIAARGEKDLESTAKELKATGLTVLPINADVTKTSDVNKLITKITEEFGTIHILVNNAGGVHNFLFLEELNDRDWQDTFELNFFSNVKVTRAVLPYMQKQKWGRIINISSESAVQPDAVIPHYNAAKAAVNNFTKTLSKAYSQDGILINAVSPAFIMTPKISSIIREKANAENISEEEFMQRFTKKFRPHMSNFRPGKPSEVASLVTFLASDNSTFINGSNIRVDGGAVLTI